VFQLARRHLVISKTHVGYGLEKPDNNGLRAFVLDHVENDPTKKRGEVIGLDRLQGVIGIRRAERLIFFTASGRFDVVAKVAR
jgi:hypothetical protein